MKNKRILNRKHDTILFYAKTGGHLIDPPTEQWTREEIIRVRKQAIYKDEDGREWVWMPGGKGKSKNKPKYLDEIIREGKAIDDVWDIPVISSSSKERVGYPTQKPEALLERIITMSSKRGDVVLDPFCGCGTALAVAHKLQRQWIGMDISHKAIDVISERLSKLGASFEIVRGIETVEDLYSLGPLAFQDFIIDRVYGTPSDKKSGDMGIDGYSFMEGLPIQVKRSKSVGRNVVDNFHSAIRRAGSHKGYIIAFSFGKGAHTEAARVRAAEGIEIALVEVKTLFEAGRDIAPRVVASQMEADLIHAVRLAANDPNRSRRAAAAGKRSLEEITASVRTAPVG